MKFYLEYATQVRPLRRAHVLRNENNPEGDCVCNITINLEIGEIVEQLSKDAYLCARCKDLTNIPDKRPRYKKPPKS